MPTRTGSREFAIILFCLIGIAVLNDFSHNKYRGVSNPMPTVLKALGIGGDLPRGYTGYTLYELLNKYSENRKDVEALKGVGVLGRILQEKTADITSEQGQKVGATFRISRRFSEAGTEEGSHVISVKVSYAKEHHFEANQWVLVCGKVKPDPESATSDRPEPMIEVTRIVVKDQPENPILTPQGEQGAQAPPPPGGEPGMPGMEPGHEGHGH